jgi:hypothetical protein
MSEQTIDGLVARAYKDNIPLWHSVVAEAG